MRRILPICLVVLAAALVPVQEAWAQRHPGGFKFGLNLASVESESLDGEAVLELDRRLRFAFGGFLTFFVGEAQRFAVQPEILLTQKGGTGQQVIDDQLVDTVVSVGYWEIPILGRLQVHRSGLWSSNLVAGPAIAIRRNAEVDFEISGTPVGQNTLDDQIDKNDLGVVVGGGLELSRGAYGLIADVRYTHGLTDISEDLTLSLRNRVLSVLVGVVIY